MKNIIISENQYNRLFELSEKPLVAPPADKLGLMQAFGFDLEMLNQFISSLKDKSVDYESLSGIFSSYSNMNYHAQEIFEKEHDISPTKPELNVYSKFREKAMLEFYVMVYMDINQSYDYEAQKEEYKQFLSRFNVNAQPNSETVYQRPIYQLKTEYSKIPVERMPSSQSSRFSDDGSEYFQFKTYKGTAGYAQVKVGAQQAWVKVYDSNGELIGRVWVGSDSKFEGMMSGARTEESTGVKPKYRRQGYMSAMYDLLQANGVYVIPSATLKEGAKMFWQNRIIKNKDKLDPRLLKYIQWTVNVE